MSKNTTVVSETNIGMYVWEMPNGAWVADDEGNFMNIVSMRGDRKRIAQITDAAHSYGCHAGHPLFLEGNRRVTDEEYSEQVDRLHSGQMADPYDLGNLIEAYKEGKTND